jgi:thioredoxin 1
MAAGVLELDEVSFRDKINSTKPVLVDFWAPWCGPCRMMTPLVEKLAGEIGDQALVTKLNTDDNPNITAELGITGIPTFMVFKDGKQVERYSGSMRYEALVQMVKKHVS